MIPEETLLRELLTTLPIEIIKDVTGLSRATVFRLRRKAQLGASEGEWRQSHRGLTGVSRGSQDGLTGVSNRSQAGVGTHLSLVNTPPVPSGHPPQGGPSKPRKKQKSKWTVVPDDWKPNERHVARAKEQGVDFEKQLELFRLHEFKDPKSDADRAFMRWLTNAKDFAPQGAPPGLRRHREYQSEERPPAPYHRPFRD